MIKTNYVDSLHFVDQCPLMRLAKLSSDWSIHTAIESVQTADSCLEYHQIICQRKQLNQGTLVPYWALRLSPHFFFAGHSFSDVYVAGSDFHFLVITKVVANLHFTTLAEIDDEEIPFVTVTEPTEQPRADEIKITPNETIKYSCTGTCIGKQLRSIKGIIQMGVPKALQCRPFILRERLFFFAGLAVILAIVIIICLCLLAAIVYIKRYLKFESRY